MMAASRQHRSVALEADARHLYTDVWTSAGVVVGVALVQITGWLWLDPVVAIGVAANIIREGARRRLAFGRRPDGQAPSSRKCRRRSTARWRASPQARSASTTW